MLLALQMGPGTRFTFLAFGRFEDCCLVLSLLKPVLILYEFIVKHRIEFRVDAFSTEVVIS